MKIYYYCYDYQNYKLKCEEHNVLEINDSCVCFSDVRFSDVMFEIGSVNLFLGYRSMFTFKKLNKTQENKLESQIETELLKKIGVIR